MGYMKIPNLYKVESELLNHYRNLYVMEKVHGTSAHVTINGGVTHYHSGGCKHDRFVEVAKRPGMTHLAPYAGEYARITFFGEAFGGNIQKMRHVYGDNIQFVVFDVLLHHDSIGSTDLTRPGSYRWLDTPDAQKMASRAGYDFVPYTCIDLSDLSHNEAVHVLNSHRDRYSGLGHRLGYPNQWGEGIVIKPTNPGATFNNGNRAIAKYKTAAFLERERQPARQADITVEHEAQRIAEDWVNEMRLSHVTDKLTGPLRLEDTPRVCAAMLKDVMDESAGEIAWSKSVERAVKVRAAELFKASLRND